MGECEWVRKWVRKRGSELVSWWYDFCYNWIWLNLKRKWHIVFSSRFCCLLHFNFVCQVMKSWTLQAGQIFTLSPFQNLRLFSGLDGWRKCFSSSGLFYRLRICQRSSTITSWETLHSSKASGQKYAAMLPFLLVSKYFCLLVFNCLLANIKILQKHQFSPNEQHFKARF